MIIFLKEEQIIYLNKEGKKAYELCNIADSLGYQVYLCQYNDNRSIFCDTLMVTLTHFKMGLKNCFIISRNISRQIMITRNPDTFSVISNFMRINTIIMICYESVTYLRKS